MDSLDLQVLAQARDWVKAGLGDAKKVVLGVQQTAKIFF